MDTEIKCMTDDLAIPTFLRRTNQSTGEQTMRPADTQAAKSDPAEAGVDGQQEKKKRKHTELPAILVNGDVVAEMSLQALIDRKGLLDDVIALHQRQELDLRAVNAEIRKRAR